MSHHPREANCKMRMGPSTVHGLVRNKAATFHFKPSCKKARGTPPNRRAYSEPSDLMSKSPQMGCGPHWITDDSRVQKNRIVLKCCLSLVLHLSSHHVSEGTRSAFRLVLKTRDLCSNRLVTSLKRSKISEKLVSFKCL